MPLTPSVWPLGARDTQVDKHELVGARSHVWIKHWIQNETNLLLIDMLRPGVIAPKESVKVGIMASQKN